MSEYSSILDALDNHNRVIFCNNIKQGMCIVDYDAHEYQSGIWHSDIILLKEGKRCASIIIGSYKEWFIDDNNQICIIP